MLAACRRLPLLPCRYNRRKPLRRAIQLLEVDYPSASFGADSLAAGAVFNYRIQLRGSSPIKVQYTTVDRHQVQIVGPALFELQQGQLQIILLPGGKAEFHPQLTP